MSIFNPKRGIAICLILLLLATACARRAETFSEPQVLSETESVSEEAEAPSSSEATSSEEEAASEASSSEESEAPAEPSPEEEPSAEPETQASEPESSPEPEPPSETPSEQPSAEPEPELPQSQPSAEPEPLPPVEQPPAEPEPEPEPESSEESVIVIDTPAPLQPVAPIASSEEPEEEIIVAQTQPEMPAAQAYSSVIIDGLTYINGIPIVNKTYSVPREYAPGVNPTAYAAFETMRDAAAGEGINLFIISGYRSYDHQANTYQRYVSRDGQAAADRYSARPGHSEHQTGLCFDLNSLLFSFGDTAEGQWLAAHCAEYGFIIRYPVNGESSTGYRFEPWHVRYLGTELAQSVTASGLTLEDYLGITSVYAE